MKLRNKMALCMVIVFTLFTIALGVAIAGMQNATTRFEGFIRQDQAFLGAGTSLYAQGLQMGQALRNIILAPENQQGYKNLSAARDEFRKAHGTAVELARDDPAVSQTLAKLKTLHERQTDIQAAVVELAKADQAAAIKKLNADETPLWRQMRGDLLELIKSKNGAVDAAKGELTSQTRATLILSLALAAVAVLLGAGIAFWLTRNVMHQLGGEPHYAAEIAGSIAAGDLTVYIVVDADAAPDSLMVAMRTMQQSLAALVMKVRAGTDTMSTASSEIAAGNMDLSGRTEEQASSLEETAASMEELTTTVQHNTDSVRQANTLATAASDVAMRGGKVVAEVVGTMGSINESARRIADIIGVIDGIAFQTNILALNAAVEAARAGEQGRGFAVVATEVRNLAQRSAAAAREIKGLIGDSVEKVEIGSKLVDTAGSTMKEVVDSVRRVTDIMAEITTAGQEQSAGIVQVNQAIAQMDKVTQQNAALVEQAAAAAASMQDQARELSAVVGTFTVSGAAHAPRRVAARSAPVPALR
ncbi:chemotaxis protein [Massilia sp. CCM 8733]|uniref:Chemotaxis protein n=1 Tax=Massilia mucilaginosa TaxID=2609282 RepID=A0ABX0P0S4_9BURK|nr:methyl-accepting chemotaxis protein [Massilia mucilaginosa]NHZ92654.1 chemotaxis protein [Massilia mucilaginosa]